MSIVPASTISVRPSATTLPLKLSPILTRGRTIVSSAVPASPASTSVSPSTSRKPALSTSSRRAVSAAMAPRSASVGSSAPILVLMSRSAGTRRARPARGGGWGPPDGGGGPPGAGAKHRVFALDEPQPRNTRVEDPHAGVDDALEHLFERQRPREGLGQPRQALELSTLLFGLGAQRGLSDGGVEQQGDRFEPAVRVPGESAIVGREQEQHAPGRLADVDGHRDLGAIAEGRVLGPDGDDPATAKGVAEAGPVDRPRRKGLDALVRHAALGNEREPSAARLESVDDRGRDAHEPADGLERSPKPGRQIRRTGHRAGEGAKRLTVASPLLADP